MEIFLMSLAIILGCTAFYLFHQQRNLHRPPCISGWIPWFGAGSRFGKAHLEFIEQARIKHGPVFTIFALGNRFTFVTEEDGFDVFFKSKEINFEHAVEDLPKSTFLTFHGLLYGTMKNKMKISTLYQFNEKLVEGLHEQLENLGTDGSKNLYNLVRHVLCPVTVNIIFGKGLYPTTQEDIQEFLKHFQIYDDGFQNGGQMPGCFLRNWSKSKMWLLNLFEKSITDLERNKVSDDLTLVQLITNTLRHGAKQNKAPNYAVLLLWASLSNVIPVVYWTVVYVLYNPSVYENIMEGISSVFGEAGKHKIEISKNDLKKLPLIKWCILETLHLVTPGVITRKVIEPVKILYFPEPELFKPEHWEKANLEKNAFLDEFVAFGGGKYPCPGRWLTLLEIETYVALVFYKYQFNLLDPFPKQVKIPMERGKILLAQFKQIK
uniref:Cytochrome P450 family 39 subfamily A member 1 n=1 Tax=Vombatus ursinus TaxID=29139 RepID=A0A4X2K8P6_VOMUR